MANQIMTNDQRLAMANNQWHAMKSNLPGATKNIQRGVKFHSSSKTWDGQRVENQILERLVSEFFQPKPSTKLLQHLLHDCREKELRNAHNQLCIVAQRLKQRKRTPLLPNGGGKGICLKGKNLLRILQLLAILKAIHQKCVQQLQRRKKLQRQGLEKEPVPTNIIHRHVLRVICVQQ